MHSGRTNPVECSEFLINFPEEVRAYIYLSPFEFYSMRTSFRCSSPKIFLLFLDCSNLICLFNLCSTTTPEASMDISDWLFSSNYR